MARSRRYKKSGYWRRREGGAGSNINSDKRNGDCMFHFCLLRDNLKPKTVRSVQCKAFFIFPNTVLPATTPPATWHQASRRARPLRWLLLGGFFPISEIHHHLPLED